MNPLRNKHNKPTCWDCGGELRPVIRPDSKPWWWCSCNRLVPVDHPADAAEWADAVAAEGLEAVPVYLFSWEIDKIAS